MKEENLSFLLTLTKKAKNRRIKRNFIKNIFRAALSRAGQIVITPRNYAFNFRHVGDMKNHYAIIGMAHVAEDYPLYYDAMR